MNDRERGAIGYLLDSDKLARVILNKYDMREWHTVTPYRSVLVYGQDRQWGIVNEEGVGTVAPDYDGTSVIYFGLSRPSDKSKTSQYISGDAIEVTWQQIDHCRTGEPIDLADFIRTFGWRLDNNHSIWYGFADKMLEDA
jgi:hypothetical protein